MIILTQPCRSSFRENDNAVFYIRTEPSSAEVKNTKYSVPRKWVPRVWANYTSPSGLNAVDKSLEKSRVPGLDSDHSDSSEANSMHTLPVSLIRHCVRKRRRHVCIVNSTSFHPLTTQSSQIDLLSNETELPPLNNQLNKQLKQQFKQQSSQGSENSQGSQGNQGNQGDQLVSTTKPAINRFQNRTVPPRPRKAASEPTKPAKLTIRLKIPMPHLLKKNIWKPVNAKASKDTFKDLSESVIDSDFPQILSIPNDNTINDDTSNEDSEEMELYENRTAPLTLNPQRRFCRINPDFLRVIVAKREMYHHGKLNYVSCPQFRSPRMDDIPKRPKIIEQMGISVGWTKSFRRNWRELSECDFS